MKFNQYLTEKRVRDVISVDVQPMYASYLQPRMDMYDFTQFLLKQNRILYYFNGPNTVGEDTKRDIISWLYEESDYNDDLYKKLNSSQTIWYDKGYAFFRGWLDNGADWSFIKKAIRFMMQNKVNDSRDIEPDIWEEKFPNEWEDYMVDDMIYLPDIPLNVLKKFQGAYIVGGGKNECLKEVQILMSIFNIKATPVKEFIY